MKINGYGPRELYSAYTHDGKPAEEKTSSISSGAKESADRVEISAGAARLDDVRSLTDTRTEDSSARAARVADIQRRVQDGSYHVSADTVAKSLLGGQVDRQV